MSATTMTGASETTLPIAGPPPIAMLLPLLQPVLTALALSMRLGVRFLLTLVYPLRTLWFIINALLSPITIAVKLTLDIVLFVPFSIIRMVAVAFYPVYVFCAVACITGVAVGIFGHYISTAILQALAQTKYFARPPDLPPMAAPTISQGTLRKRKLKSVRLQ